MNEVGRPSLIAQEFRQAKPIDICGTLPDEDQLEICRKVSQEFLRLGLCKQARSYLGHALSVCKQGDIRTRAELLSELGLVLFYEGNWVAALQEYKASWELGASNNDFDKARVLTGIANQLFNMGDWDQAETLYRMAMNDRGHGIGKYCAKLNLAILLWEKGYHDRAMQLELELEATLADLDATGYAQILANRLYKCALLNDAAHFDRLYGSLVSVVGSEYLTVTGKGFLYDVLDSELVLRMNQGQLDDAAALLTELEALIQDPAVSYRFPYLALRKASWQRVTGQADTAFAGLQQAMKREHWEPLVEAFGLYELALCANAVAMSTLELKFTRGAIRLFRRLGIAEKEIRRRRSALQDWERKAVSDQHMCDQVLIRFLGQSPMIQEIRRKAVKIARTNSIVVLYGESGTGKSILARVIHDLSPRSSEAFVRFDCTCNDEGLLESLLFGHARGAFTGAIEARRGLVDEADGGTLFVDEVSDLPLHLQGKLLALLEDGSFRAVGGSRLRRADIRFVVATNRDLVVEVQNGRFRNDLFHRLGSIQLTLPPLREHREDVEMYVHEFMRELNRVYGVHKSISRKTTELLQYYSWPGNVRELKKVLEKGVLLGDSGEITIEDLGLSEAISLPEQQAAKSLRDLEREHIAHVLSIVGGNRSQAARLLGLKRTTLYSRMAVLGLT